jgi:hypothetical protein
MELNVTANSTHHAGYESKRPATLPDPVLWKRWAVTMLTVGSQD